MSGVDWAPLLELLLIGLAVAAVPLAVWIWKAKSGDPRSRLRALTLLTLFLTFDLIVFGAFTRLSDSGLGCPDWPGCYGQASPLGARAEIAAEQALRPTGPVTHGKAWVEMVHRYWASGVGFLILVMAGLAWRWRRLPLPHPGWSALTLAWVLVQGGFGALTVTWKLFPAIVTLHLLFGLGLMVLLALHAERLQPRPLHLPPAVMGLWWAAGALLWLQIVLGGWVSTNYAVLICSDFPTCQGRWWPEADFSEGFRLWRELGREADGGWLAQPALTAIHLAHRMGAVFATAALLALAWSLRRAGESRWAVVFAVLVGLQVFSGVSNVVLGWPLLAALLHSGGAAALVLTWTVLGARLHAARQAQPNWREALA
ncbi:heme A synthase [Inhella sp.]|uniref:COX15/CtaA family protein n=1 Tax=Inhella sp. TaxID=1921806 RepID=UPI0035B03361